MRAAQLSAAAAQPGASNSAAAFAPGHTHKHVKTHRGSHRATAPGQLKQSQ